MEMDIGLLSWRTETSDESFLVILFLWTLTSLTFSRITESLRLVVRSVFPLTLVGECIGDGEVEGGEESDIKRATAEGGDNILVDIRLRLAFVCDAEYCGAIGAGGWAIL